MNRRTSSAFAAVLALVCFLLTATPASLQAQAPAPPIPSGHVRIHYFRPDGNYLGWTVYAFGDTTENTSNFNGGPVKVTGQDGFGAYFDVGVTATAQNVGIIIHNGGTKDPGPNEFIDPATQGNEYWQLSGSNVLHTTQPPTIQQVDPPIPSGKARIHYHRPDNNYATWNLFPFFATTDPNSDFCGTNDFVSGYDTYGAYFDVGVDPTKFNGQLGFIIHNCNIKDPGPDMHLQLTQNIEAWVLSGSATVFLTQPTTEFTQEPPIPAHKARIHYFRPDSNYASWTVYAFGDTTEDTGNFNGGPVFVTGYDTYGAFYDVGLTPNPHDLGFIVHNISTGTKDPGPDMHLNVGLFNEAWVISGDAQVFTTQPTAAQLLDAVFFKQQAFWIDRTTVAIQSQFLQSGFTYFLNFDPNANLQLTSTAVTGGSNLSLTPFAGGFSAAEQAAFPQLSGYAVLHLPANVDPSVLAGIVKGQVAVSGIGSDGTLKYVTSVQMAGVLDDLFFFPGRLGVIFHHGGEEDGSHDGNRNEDNDGRVSIRVWAPTAQSMNLQLFDHAADAAPSKVVPMTQQNGVWSASGDDSWKGKYYLFDLKVYVPSQRAIVENFVTDPYSVDLALNGVKSRITNLDDMDTQPEDWEESSSPALSSVNDLSIYELHIRDFSANDLTVPQPLRGTYLAFSGRRTNGMKHLEALADAGLKAVHLLPSFHFASINEDKTTWQTTGDLSVFPPDGTQQQAAVAAIQNTDAFNWGYDPVHYFAPEGAYALNPDNRVREYREMVKGLHRAGLRVIQDVVFNHTSAVGEAPNSVLDEVVPGYYYRLDADGNQLSGSCCPDTAPEHKMMGKLITDAVVLNAQKYKIDGFRFDLMSFLFVFNMQQIQAALAKLTPEKDGVDGSKIYLYGEGFDFGEVANNALGVNASQRNLFGTGIGTFNDRIRDGIRGGSPFTDERVQGFATGLFTDSSSFTNQSQPPSAQLGTLLEETDWIEVGLAGNLRDWTFTDHTGATVTGAQVNYNGQQAGYTASPIEDIDYASVHDNQTLFDAVQLKSAASDDIAARTRRQVLAMSLVALGQGVPFFHAGDDLLRSKDMDGNSYNSGDWFNKLDFSYQSDNWGTGLPIASQNQGNWPLMQPLLANPALKPAPADIAHARDAFREFLEIRGSSGLFHMHTLAEVQANLHFLNAGPSETPGLIVIKLDANGGDFGRFQHIVVVFNATNAPVSFQNSALVGLKLRLHEIQRHSTDSVVKQSSFDAQAGTVAVPALTTAVFVTEQP
jgi:pullulanase